MQKIAMKGPEFLRNLMNLVKICARKPKFRQFLVTTGQFGEYFMQKGV